MQSFTNSSGAGSSGFSEYVLKLTAIQDKITTLTSKADLLREEALELEYEMMSQSLFAPVDPSLQDMKDVEMKYERAKELVSTHEKINK